MEATIDWWPQTALESWTTESHLSCFPDTQLLWGFPLHSPFTPSAWPWKFHHLCPGFPQKDLPSQRSQCGEIPAKFSTRSWRLAVSPSIFPLCLVSHKECAYVPSFVSEDNSFVSALVNFSRTLSFQLSLPHGVSSASFLFLPRIVSISFEQGSPMLRNRSFSQMYKLHINSHLCLCPLINIFIFCPFQPDF